MMSLVLHPIEYLGSSCPFHADRYQTINSRKTQKQSPETKCVTLRLEKAEWIPFFLSLDFFPWITIFQIPNVTLVVLFLLSTCLSVGSYLLF